MTAQTTTTQPRHVGRPTGAARDDLYARDGFRCAYCGRKVVVGAGDSEQVVICDCALAGDRSARYLCWEVIEAAKAMDDDEDGDE